ncbi:hypothetical protein [Pseudoduganella albidiflava]|uniref:Uncharacterized protein n=1 Tax=Pseudoduganella albidiflava TaxID=321983 RepID=A0A411WV97_9BURK|nr:hypothetical protein [Pseudoduganella albidiflava]QBI00713.1 hypothetical protein EYF70_07490 [Pseudoduganella albidiflava]GGY31183.1 hypothetical protein GCM10007387_11480 [Pseudoduganella albidiflava]
MENPVSAPASDTYVIEGVLTDLHVALGRENLLAQINPHYRAGSAAAGLGTAVGEFHGQVAAAASVAMYDGEDTENFACLIGQQVMCGTFGGASKLPVDKKVKAVVSRDGDVLIAHGILSEDMGLVWVRHAWGSKAERKANLKMAWGAFGFAMICEAACIYFFGVNPWMSELETLALGAVIAGVLCFGNALWSSGTMNALANPATDVFRKLGFADPECINLSSYQYGIVNFNEVANSSESSANYSNIHCYKKAIEDGKLELAR